MKFIIITTQPSLYDSFLKTGLIARGINRRIIKINIINLYDFGSGAHRSIDDTPYGGGPGMIIRADVMERAIKFIKLKAKSPHYALRALRGKQKLKAILLTPQGKKFDQKMAKKLAKVDELILIAGRFEGYDERIRDLADEEISIGDYVLTSGDLPAAVLIDAISRQIPGFIEKKASLAEESFSKNCLEYPQYTRPENFRGKHVPEILLSGNHQKIASWRKEQALGRTKKRRKDLLA